jgi:hypothetical protein
MATPKETVTIEMTKTKETKGTWMYGADDDTTPVTNIYFNKAGLDKIGMAEKVKVTIEKIS